MPRVDLTRLELRRNEQNLAKAEQLWGWLTLSIPADAALLFYNPLLLKLEELTPTLNYLLALLSALALLGLFRARIFDLLLDLQGLQKRLSNSRLGSGAAIALVAGVSLFEMALKVGKLGLYPILIFFGLALLTLPAIIKNIQSGKQHTEQLEHDPLLWLNQANLRLFYLVIAPLFAARAVSLVAALRSNLDPHSLSAWIPFALASFVLLLTIRPHRSDFISSCKTCQSWTAHALRRLGPK